MARRSDHGARGRSASEQLTVLEKLVLRALPTRKVPAESGVQFAVSSKARDDGICLVLLIDDREDPVFAHAEGPRADYLVIHASRAGCILTIVEMKGREKNGFEHGVDQILAIHRRLRQEMAASLPGSWRRATIQAVLLTPQNAQINRVRIDAASKAGIEILPLQYHHQAELYPYISRPVSRTERYEHAKLPRSEPELNDVELLLTRDRLDRRVRDDLFQRRRGGDPDTFYLNFRPREAPSALVSLSANTKDAVLAFSPGAVDTRKMVSAHLTRHALACPALRVGS